MFTSRTTVLVVAAFTAALPALADEKKDAKKYDADKLLGSWLAEEGGMKATMTFAKDGKITIVAAAKDKEVTLVGTYKIEGDKFTISIGKGPAETETIEKLNDEEFVTKDDKGKTTTLKRVKDKK